MYAKKKCVICGAEYQPTSGQSKTCSLECRKELIRRYQKEHGAEKRARLREKKKAQKARPKKRPPIVCEGYAERQKAETIEMFARIKL